MTKDSGKKFGNKLQREVDRIIYFFSSMKLGLVLLLLLGGVAAAGSFLPAQQDFYRSPIFRILLAVLALNLGICSLKRVRTVAAVFKRKPKLLFEKIPTNVPLKESFTLKLGWEKTIDSTRHLLQRYRFQVAENKSKKIYLLEARKACLGLWGSLLTHFGFLIILLGVLIGSIWGCEGVVNVPVGGSFRVSDVLGRGDFYVFVDDFQIERYTNGSPSQYISSVHIIEGSNVTQNYQISINNPLNYRSIKFYQSTWGNAFKLVFKNQEESFTIMVQLGKLVPVPGTDYKIYTYRYDEKDSKLIYALYKGGSRAGVGAAGISEVIQIKEGVSFSFNGNTRYTGLKVKTDPGVPVIWAGSGLLLAGIIMSLYWRPRFLWIVIKDEGKRVQVQMTGNSPKNNHSFKKEFYRLIERIKLLERERKA